MFNLTRQECQAIVGSGVSWGKGYGRSGA